MEKLRLALFSLGMLLAATLALSCGASSKNMTGQLQSITITPATAAAGLPGEQIQFTAIGHYNTAPYTVTPQPATWVRAIKTRPQPRSPSPPRVWLNVTLPADQAPNIQSSHSTRPTVT